MPINNFICIHEIEHRSILNDRANNKVIEKIFIPKHQLDLWNECKNKDSIFEM